MQIPFHFGDPPGDLPVVGGRNLSQLRQQGAIQACGVFHLAADGVKWRSSNDFNSDSDTCTVNCI
jgi:hypothetical protein